MCNKKTEHIYQVLTFCVGGVVFHEDCVVISSVIVNYDPLVINAGLLSVRGR
jgi:hypothetical protein